MHSFFTHFFHSPELEDHSTSCELVHIEGFHNTLHAIILFKSSFLRITLHVLHA